MVKVHAKDFLGKEVAVEIDRPLGTRHPKHGFMYMLNYGFVPNTISGDGEDKHLIVYEEHVDTPFHNEESLKDVEKRIKSFIDDVLKDYKGKLLVSLHIELHN